MKKIYLSAFSLAIVMSASAQLKKQDGPVKRSNDRLATVKANSSTTNVEKAVPFWTNDFSTPADWDMSLNTSSTGTGVWNIVTDPAAVPAAGPATMATAANGYALIDSDTEGNGATQDAYIAYVGNTGAGAGVINCSAYPNVILRFQQHYRTFQDTRTLEVSNDGGTSWTAFTETDGTEVNTNVDGSKAFNITSVAGSQSSVMIRFHYVAAWGWHWAVDDIEIEAQPLDDIQIVSSWIVGTDNDGIEYGKTPIDQLPADWLVGSSVFNFGADDQTNINLAVDFGSFNSASANALIESDSTRLLESTETPTLAVGVYNGTYTATSALEVGGANFANNVGLRSFEVTNDVYAIDGIDVHPASELALTSMGSNSFTGAEDGLVLAAMYFVKNTATIYSLEVQLANGTVAGGEIYASIIDTGVFLNNATTPLFLSQPYTVTAADVTAGFCTVPFDTGFEPVLTAGVYFAAVELYSNSNQNDIRILDDITVAQPFYGSMIFIPGDQTYSNGTAIGIRMNTAEPAGIDEYELAGISVYPNPSKGIIKISNDNNTDNTIAIFDMLGKEVYSTTSSTGVSVDLSGNGRGVYLVKVSNENGSMVERIVIR
tara:strand:+ start:21221 stop:23023 length:1803 start_codon:yes stop_codon:yes gene_type:complete